MPIVLYWNIFIDVDRPEEIRKFALESIYSLENKKLRQIAENKIKINPDNAMTVDDLLHSTFLKIIEASNEGRLQQKNSRDAILGYLALTMQNICLDGYRRRSRHNEIVSRISFSEIDDIIGFDFIQGFKKFGQSQENRSCYELIKLKAGGYSYRELIDAFENYRELEVGALTQRYLRCKDRLNEFLNR